MQLFKNVTSLSLPYPAAASAKEGDLLFFDIETTGFSADISSVYLIGVLYYEENNWQMIQWFADDYKSEEKLLIEFFEFLKGFSILIHYNGSGFDIPYLLKKCRQYHLSYDFSGIESIDLYKHSSFLKNHYSLENRKQKSIERFLGIYRKDKYSGGELIEVYSTYMQNKILSKPYEELLQALLLHNAEDIEGLFSCTKILAYTDFFHGAFETRLCAKKKDLLTIIFRLVNSLPVPLTIVKDQFTLHAEDSSGYLEIKLYQGELKYFYKDYKNYYYLPKEDSAIHKSVAAYVDKDYKEKAKAANCYTRKTGIFLPQKRPLFEPSFKEDYKSALCYFEADEAFYKDRQRLHEYLCHLFLNLS